MTQRIEAQSPAVGRVEVAPTPEAGERAAETHPKTDLGVEGTLLALRDGGYINHKPECEKDRLDGISMCDCGHGASSHEFMGLSENIIVAPRCRRKGCVCGVFKAKQVRCTCGLDALLTRLDRGRQDQDQELETRVDEGQSQTGRLTGSTATTLEGS